MSKVKKLLLEKNALSKTLDDARFMEWFEQTVARAGEDLQMIDMDYSSQYNSEVGFKVGVECIHQNRDRGFFAVIASVNPPASLYSQDPPESPGDLVKVFTQVDWQKATVHSVRFTEGLQEVQRMEANKGASIVLDVRFFSVKEQQWRDYGWTLLPLLSELETNYNPDNGGELYLKSGLFSLPLFKGRPIPEVLAGSVASKNPWSYILEQRAVRKIVPIQPTTLIVRLVDN